jgi:hypothetical protein
MQTGVEGRREVTSSVDFLLAESAIEKEAGEDENYSQPLAPQQAVPEEDD